MKRRNWLDLSRKLVDGTDMDFSDQGVQAYLSEQALNFFGEGVLSTSLYPNPFPITLSGSNMTGTVGNGIGFDPNGQITRIDTGSPTSKTFTVPTADPTFQRWDLLVIRYKQTGDTLIPKPSDPITSVFLNLHDDFELAVIPGTPSATPTYPAKGAHDIILAGLRVPPATTIASFITLDLGIREIALPNIPSFPEIIHEIPTGNANGTNMLFVLSQMPLNQGSLLLLVDGLVQPKGTWSLVGTNVTFNTAPALAVTIDAFYIADVPSSVNPLAANQEVPAGNVNGSNDTFTLTGVPANKISTLVYVDGAAIKASEWTLIQGPTGSSIKFVAGSIPALGQDLYCFYFINPATVGIGGGGGGSGVASINSLTGAINLLSGSGINLNQSGQNITLSAPGTSGGLTAHGTDSSPVTIDPSVGIPASGSEQRAIWQVVSQGGAQTVIANPQIAAGTTVGQELIVSGTSDTNYSILNDGNGLLINGPVNLKLNASIQFFWTGSLWKEISRW